MLIAQTKSFGRTMSGLSNKDVKLFLFNSVMPTAQANIPFNPEDPFEVYANCVAVEETVLSVTADGGIVLKADPDVNGIEFKGSGPDVVLSGATNWLIPTGIATNLTVPEADRFDFLRILQQPGLPGNTYVQGSKFKPLDYIRFDFDYGVDVDGIYFLGTAATTHTDFDVQYWDETLLEGAGDWVTIVSQVANASSYRVAFPGTVTTTQMQIVFTGTSSANGILDYIRFYSNDTAPATNFSTVDAASWAMMFIDIKGHGSAATLGTAYPYIWFPVGNPRSPNTATFTSIDIVPAVLPKLIHAEFVGDIVGDV